MPVTIGIVRQRTLSTDNDNDGQPDPGDIFLHSIIIQNTGDEDALDVFTSETENGYTIDPGGDRNGISPLIAGAIDEGHPHIILLMIGTNDIDINLDLANLPTRLGNLLDSITTEAPDALLVVANLTPSTDITWNNRIVAYNNAIPGLVQTRAAAGKHIVMVNMNAAFLANPNWKTALMYDALHPNDAGYAVMASVWYTAISGYLPGP